MPESDAARKGQKRTRQTGVKGKGRTMTIVELLERNARLWPEDTALVEIYPDQPETRRVTWHDFELV